MTSVHVGLNERSCYGYDVVIRNCDGRTPSWWDIRLQEERIACRLDQVSLRVNGVLTNGIVWVRNFSP